MRLLAFLMMMFASCLARADAGSWRVLGYQDIWMGAPATADDVQRALATDLTNTMKKFYPNGKNICCYNADGTGVWTRVSFTATKGSSVFKETVSFVGTAAAPGKSSWCPEDSLGSYYLEFNLSGSSAIVTENADAFGLDICVYRINDDSYTIKSKVWMREGSDFGGRSGDFTQKMLRAQAFPLLLAITRRAGELAELR